MATGNGAYVVHRQLAERIPGYELIGYSPRRTYFPPSLIPLGRRPGQRADILHVTPDYAPFHAGIARHNVITFHNYVLDPAMRAHSSRLQWIHYRTDLRLFTRRALAMADVVTCVSEQTRTLLVEDLGWRGPVTVIPNGVDTTRFRPAAPSSTGGGGSEGALTALFSGNTSRRKGFHFLAPLAERLPRDIRLVYTGGLNEARRVPTAHHLVSLGSVAYPEMPRIYRAADVLLVTSIREGHSLAVLEAMASGLPVVGFNVSSLPEQVANGDGGCLVPYGDLDALATALATLQREPQMRAAMGAYNRQRTCAEFTLERMTDAYHRLFGALA
jgi:glycosyltransferase involved in cell wall biosynthesis